MSKLIDFLNKCHLFNFSYSLRMELKTSSNQTINDFRRIVTKLNFKLEFFNTIYLSFNIVHFTNHPSYLIFLTFMELLYLFQIIMFKSFYINWFTYIVSNYFLSYIIFMILFSFTFEIINSLYGSSLPIFVHQCLRSCVVNH